MKIKFKTQYLSLSILIILLPFLWLRGGLDKIFLDSDLARDLSEISKLWIGQKIIWLGPRFSVGLHSSPIYYYLFYIPVWISKGSPYSLIVFNVILAALSLLFLGYFCIKKFGAKGLFIPLLIGLVPWWQGVAIHPGNGFSYAIFLLGFLTALWFKLPVVLSSFLLGISLSMHPGAVFGLPLLLYQLFRCKTTFKTWLLSMFAFLLPFTPLIAFEIITKGYWLKQWLAQPNFGVGLSFGIGNIVSFFKVSGINIFLGLILLLYMIFISQKRERAWIFLNLIGLFSFFLFNAFPKHYFFGIITIIWFTTLLIIGQKRFGKVVLLLLSIYFVANVLITPEPIVSERSIPKIEGTIEYLVNNGNISKGERLALVALKSADTKTPQADDYRFFLRVRGYIVEEVSDYAKAEKLVIFVEDKKLDWQNWNSWETDEFGKGELSDKLEINDIIIAVYKKKHAD